jgi:hypothetical protein
MCSLLEKAIEAPSFSEGALTQIIYIIRALSLKSNIRAVTGMNKQNKSLSIAVIFCILSPLFVNICFAQDKSSDGRTTDYACPVSSNQNAEAFGRVLPSIVSHSENSSDKNNGSIILPEGTSIGIDING